MWYVLWTTEGNEENTRQMIDAHVDHSLFTRCVVPYRKKREFFGSRSVIVQKLLFPSYVFIETDRVNEFAERLQWYPGKNVMLRTGETICPIYREEEYFLTKLLNKQDVIDISEGFMDGGRVHVVSGPLTGFEDRIKKVIWRKSLAVLEMNLFYRTTQTYLGLDKLPVVN